MKKIYSLLLALAVSLLTLQAGAAMYIVGDAPFGSWNPAAGVKMTDKGNGTHTYTATISGTVYFVFGNGLSSSWDTFNSTYRYGPVSDGQVVTANNVWIATQRSTEGAYKFTGNGSKYVFTFDTVNKRFKIAVEGDTFNPVTGHLYILGEAEGNNWDPSVGVEMSTTDGNLFTATVTFNGENSEEDANVSYFSFTTKLADSSTDWESISGYRFTPNSSGNLWVTTNVLGLPLVMNPLGVNPDVSFRIPAGTYDLTVDVNDLTTTITHVGGGEVVSGKAWPAMFGGVMLQGFYWDSYKLTKWTNMTSKAQELGQFFDVVWIPNSASLDEYGTSESMGYMPVYWLKHNTVFGTESQLREMISTLHEHNTSVIGDMVINHKSGKSGWVDFPNESVTGSKTGARYSVTWSLADICSTDECVAQGYAATGAPDEGENFDGSRDLDHTSANVQKNVKTYQKFLINEFGYDGFRYDMCKGFAGYYVGLYNQASVPSFSVGEYWDGNVETLRWWLNSTKQNDRIQSAVFDFALKYSIQSAFAGGTWSALNNKGLAADVDYQRYSVTFVDNHDTGQSTNYDCLKSNVMAANAFILAMPGTPCIFYKHYNVYAKEINNCIRARRAAGVHNQSGILTQQESNGGYILETQGTRGKLYLQLGGAVNNSKPSGYTLVQSGDAYKLYISNGIDWQHVAKDGSILGYPIVSRSSGTYVGSVTLTVSPSAAGTTLVYTTDGSVPTANSATLTASKVFTFNENTTLRVGVLYAGHVENVEEYVYTIADEASSGINIYVKPTANNAYIWAWTTSGSVTGSNWPGKAIRSLEKVTVNDIEWYCLHVNANKVSLIFNDGGDGFENQTSTIEVSRDAFFFYPNSELSTYAYAAADTYLDVTAQYAGAGSASFEHVYVLGNINSTGWAPNNGFAMTTTNGEKYTATIDFVEPYGAQGYSYFSFTTALASSSSAWSEIASSRMGATSNNFLISEPRLGTNLAVVAGENSFKIATGKYNLTLYLSQGILVVDKWIEPITVVRGDVDKDGNISISDVTALIDYLLSGNAEPISTENADCDQDGNISISDVTSLIDYLLSGSW